MFSVVPNKTGLGCLRVFKENAMPSDPPERSIVEMLRAIQSKDRLINCSPGHLLFRSVHDICQMAAREIENLQHQIHVLENKS